MTTRSGWATAFLEYAGWPVSLEKVIALVAQASREDSGADWNPLNTTEPAPGDWDFNSAGVKSYPSEAVGMGATLATFLNGYYPGLVAILSDPAGGSALAYASNLELNTWGTRSCVAEVESIKNGDPYGYMVAEVVGVGGAPSPGPPPQPAPPPPPPIERDQMNGWTDANGVRHFAGVYSLDHGGNGHVIELVETGINTGAFQWFDRTDAVTNNSPTPCPPLA